MQIVLADGSHDEENEETYDENYEITWLAKQPIDVWMDFIRYGDPTESASNYTMFWLCSQPQLDRGCATLLFWKLITDYVYLRPVENKADLDHDSRDRMRALQTLVDRWNTDRFNTDVLHVSGAEISFSSDPFDEEVDRQRLKNLAEAEPLFEIPSSIYCEVIGREQRPLTDFFEVVDYDDYSPDTGSSGQMNDFIVLRDGDINDEMHDVLPAKYIYVESGAVKRSRKKKKDSWFGRFF